MPVNPDAVGSVGDPVTHSWDQRDVKLYALGGGAGVGDLALTTPNTRAPALVVLPTMAVGLGLGGA